MKRLIDKVRTWLARYAVAQDEAVMLRPCPQCGSADIGSWGQTQHQAKNYQLAECRACGHRYAYAVAGEWDYE